MMIKNSSIPLQFSKQVANKTNNKQKKQTKGHYKQALHDHERAKFFIRTEKTTIMLDV
jgi:hypothetical protein